MGCSLVGNQLRAAEAALQRLDDGAKLSDSEYISLDEFRTGCRNLIGADRHRRELADRVDGIIVLAEVVEEGSVGQVQESPATLFFVRREDFPVRTFMYVETRIGALREYAMTVAADLANARVPREDPIYQVEPSDIVKALVVTLKNYPADAGDGNPPLTLPRRVEDFPIDTFRFLERALGVIRKAVMNSACDIADARSPAHWSVYEVRVRDVDAAFLRLFNNPGSAISDVKAVA